MKLRVRRQVGSAATRAKPFARLTGTLDFALRDAHETGRRFYLLFVREQRLMTEQDTKRKWQKDPEASQIFDAAKKQAGDRPPLFCYAVSESAAETANLKRERRKILSNL